MSREHGDWVSAGHGVCFRLPRLTHGRFWFRSVSFGRIGTEGLYWLLRLADVEFIFWFLNS